MVYVSAGSVHSLAVLGQPAQRTVIAGGSTTLSAPAYASRLSTYQWQFDGNDIAGATNSTLTLGNLFWPNTGIYRVIISNPVGSITGPAITVTVPPLLFDSSSLSYQTANGAFSMRLTGASGLYPVVIYATTDLVNWTPVFTNAPTTNAIYFTDTSTNAGPNRYYRAAEQP